MNQNDSERKMTDPGVKGSRTERFWGSVSFLALTVLFIVGSLIFIVSMFDSLINTEINNGLTGFVMIFAPAAVAYSVIIAAIITFVLSFLGAFYGLTSIKHLPTRKMTIWARVVAYTNLAICISSFVFVLLCLPL